LTLACVAAKIIALKRVIVIHQSTGFRPKSGGKFLSSSTFLILIQESAIAFDCDADPASVTKEFE
jgi:hypothetical protein